MKLSGDHLKRYKQIAALFWKYGRGDLAQHLGEDEPASPRTSGAAAGHGGDGHGSNGHASASGNGSAAKPARSTPEQLADDLETLGPTYVKLGQVLSGRPDLLPAAYAKALERLQDKVKPFPYSDVERIVHEELGVRISKAFSSFDPVPIAAASLGQVHAAALRDGRSVVVKVQRPDIRRQIEEDFEVLAEIANFLDTRTEVGRRHRFSAVLEEFHVSIRQELDYQREAQNLLTLAENLEEFRSIRVPRPIHDYCTRSVLTMERVDGHKITKVSPLALLGMPRTALAEELFRAYLKQVLVDGFFHADPHPGNVFLTDDDRVALLDLGMVGHTSPAMQEHLIKLLLAVAEQKSEVVADLVIEMSEKAAGFDLAQFRRRVAAVLAARQGQTLAETNFGRSILEVSAGAAQNGLFVPSELTLLGKTLLQLDEIGRVLDGDFDPNESIRRNVGEIAGRRAMHDATKGGFFTSLMETKSFLLALPKRMNRILDSISNAELEVKVKSLDAQNVVEGIEKIANRVTTGLILAALIVGAALLMRVDTTFRLWGYPGFAMLCFLLAATGGFWLVATSLIRDHRSRRMRPRD